MRNILLVDNESYLDRAIQDVAGLVGFERQRANRDEVLDLLAVIVTPLYGDAHFASEDQTCELGCLTKHAQLFSPESVSMSGIWLLLTVSQSVMAESTERHEALTRVLSALQSKEGGRTISSVIPVFLPEESQASIVEQIAHLENEHRSIRLANSLAIDLHQYPALVRKISLRTVPE